MNSQNITHLLHSPKSICVFLGFALKKKKKKCFIWTAVIRYTEPIRSGHDANCCECELGADVIVTQWSRGRPPRSAQNCRCVSRWLLCRLSTLPTANFWYDGEVWSACDVDRRCRWSDTGSNRWRVCPLLPERGKAKGVAGWRSSVWQPRHSQKDSAISRRTTVTSWCRRRALDTDVHNLPLYNRQVVALTAWKQSAVYILGNADSHIVLRCQVLRDPYGKTNTDSQIARWRAHCVPDWRGNWILGILTSIQFIVFHLPISYKKFKQWNFVNVMFLFLFKSQTCFYFKTQRFGDWILSQCSDKTCSVGPNR
jgi:hypothetical protein